MNFRTYKIDKRCVYRSCLGPDVVDTSGVLGTKVSVVTRGVRQSPMLGFDLKAFLLPDHNVLQYLCERDHNVDFLCDRMLDGYFQIPPYSKFAVPDGPYVAKNSGKNLRS